MYNNLRQIKIKRVLKGIDYKHIRCQCHNGPSKKKKLP